MTTYEIAKLGLVKAGTFVDRQKAICGALALGMPLRQIEEHLDWRELACLIQEAADE